MLNLAVVILISVTMLEEVYVIEKITLPELLSGSHIFDTINR